MPRFDYLSQSRVDENSTRDFPFRNVVGHPVLRCAQATQRNPAAWDALVATLPRVPPLPAEPTKAQRDARKAQVREIYAGVFAEHCVRDWPRPPIAEFVDGRPVRCATFSAEECHEFLRSMIEQAPVVFDEWAILLLNGWDFEAPAWDEGSVEDLAKNSERG